MARIRCKTPSTGTIRNYTLRDIVTTGIDDWVTIAEASDFSVPDARRVYGSRDPDDAGRGIRPGELFFMTPIFVRNIGVAVCEIDVRLILEDGTSIACPGKMVIPPEDTALVPVQGRSLLKRDYQTTVGDKLQIRANIDNAIEVWATAEEKPSAEHTLETST